jgi:hypothetical protein
LGKKVLVSGSATTESLAHVLKSDAAGSSAHRETLDTLKTALARFTTAVFGRDIKIDDSALTESMYDGPRILRRLRLEHMWIVQKVKSMRRPAIDVGSRAFSR